MSSDTYRKLIATKFSSDFSSAIEIIKDKIPEPTSKQILIRNKFAGVNAGFDTLLCKGKIPYFTETPPIDLGVEAIGEVVAIGDQVKEFAVGDAVVTTQRGGGYREYQVIDEKLGFPVPIATPEVLTLMPTGVSALVALEQVGAMTSQEVVMVTAAGGGTGHIAVQLAKLSGNQVIGTCGSEAKHRLLKDLGCDRVVNYRVDNVAQVLKQEYPQGLNLVFECIGKQMFDICVDNLAVRGRLVVVGFISEYGKNPELVSQPRIYNQLFWKAASVRGFLMPLYKEYIPEARDRLLEMFSTGKIRVAIDPSEFQGLESIPAAVNYLLSGQNCGKVVVKF
ncbi:putative NADP-dependent oxidoreductase [Xenococcus sp. PCC 7305]|uniref:zinc-binding dehydrogenase n=1 Tax=Xenococcus sp. PCC 7305 TaxID=102125 RepID=UPI0002ABCAFC|nr:zinc-binding dehydrogenase [Xenococcus sp. PCC 7305]ELS01339.1 putative NADP-dependent oxidoreductase [Xenococcus sp. PCC 7305]